MYYLKVRYNSYKEGDTSWCDVMLPYDKYVKWYNVKVGKVT